jgi:DNA modification methylase
MLMNTTTFPRSLCDALLQGDCSEVMQRIPTVSIDLVVTDPPYITRYTDRYKQND